MASTRSFRVAYRSTETPPRSRRNRDASARHEPEQYRASDVYPRLIADLYQDLAAFGTERPGRHR